MRMAARLEAMGVEKYSGLTRKSGGRYVWTGRIALDESALGVPARWRKPRMIFVNSMSDLFHPDVPLEFIRRVWIAMAAAPQHVFQVLTKRPDRMREILNEVAPQPLTHVWLGTTVEDNAVVSRLDELRATPSVIRFVSFEPLIGSVRRAELTDIQWAIVGGESGPRARPMEEAWVDEIRAACIATETAFFFKQWGGRNKKAAGRTYRGRLWDEMPLLRTAPASF